MGETSSCNQRNMVNLLAEWQMLWILISHTSLAVRQRFLSFKRTPIVEISLVEFYHEVGLLCQNDSKNLDQSIRDLHFPGLVLKGQKAHLITE